MKLVTFLQAGTQRIGAVLVDGRILDFATADARLDVMVTNARKVYRYRFRRAGEETLSTPTGEIATIHLIADAPNPEDVYEVWLAPQYFHLPVKLKFYMGRYPVEQTVTSISASPN